VRCRGNEYKILFTFSLFCEYIHLEYVRIHVIYRVTQAEYVIRIRVVAVWLRHRNTRKSIPDNDDLEGGDDDFDY